MKLKSMKLDTSAQEKMAPPSVADGGDRPLYPWGLEVRLETEALETLGLADNLPEVGKGMKLEALVDVTSVSENDNRGGKSCSVTLQITDLGLAPMKDNDSEVGARLYGKGGK